MSVPFIDLKRWEKNLLEQWHNKVLALSKANSFIGGNEVQDLEKKLSIDTSHDYAITCANGTDALQLALRASNIEPGDVVLLPDYTFWATFEAIVNVGAQPVTIDIDPNDLQMNFELFCMAHKKYKAKGAILVHLYGWSSSNIDNYRKYALENDLRLIEDGAQSYGSTYKENSIYKDAQVATLSFYPAKVFGGAGDGGAILTSDQALAEKIRSLANHGRDEHYSHFYVGWNSRLDTLQAAYLNLVHLYIIDRICSRQKTYFEYQKFFSNFNSKSIKFISAPENYKENAYLNVLLLPEEEREILIKKFKEKKIGYGITYPKSISEQEGSRKYLKGKEGGDVSIKTSKSILNLPLFPYMEKEEIEEVLSTILHHFS